jgi:hypothetical protein
MLLWLCSFFSFSFFLFWLFIFVLFCFLETGSCHVTQAGFQLQIFLPQPLECWDYRHTAPHLVVPLFLSFRDVYYKVFNRWDDMMSEICFKIMQRVRMGVKYIAGGVEREGKRWSKIILEFDDYCWWIMGARVMASVYFSSLCWNKTLKWALTSGNCLWWEKKRY